MTTAHEVFPFPGHLGTEGSDPVKDMNGFADWIRMQMDITGAKTQGIRNVLDFGCGTGEEAIALSLIFPDAIIHAVDCSEAALDKAELNIDTYFPQLKDRIRLVLDLSWFEHNAFDFAYASGVLHHIKYPRKIVDRVYNLMPYGSEMLVSLYHYYGNWVYRHKVAMLDLLAGDDYRERLVVAGFFSNVTDLTPAYVDSYGVSEVNFYTARTAQYLMYPFHLVSTSPKLTVEELIYYYIRGAALKGYPEPRIRVLEKLRSLVQRIPIPVPAWFVEYMIFPLVQKGELYTLWRK